jgi:hypothetical protein
MVTSVILASKVDDSIFRTRESPEFRVTKGSVWLSFSTSKVHVFDKKTGVRVLPGKTAT